MDASPPRPLAAAEDEDASFSRAPAPAASGSEPAPDAITRDRLLASLTLIAGIALALALPFALRAGAEFFLPVTAALVISVALVPIL